MRREEEAGLREHKVAVPESSKRCFECHRQTNPGIAEHWLGSTHAQKGIGCIECHEAQTTDADAFSHEGYTIATIVTPRDCSKCHPKEADEFQNSHHAMAGNILHSLDNLLAETVEGSRIPFDPHSKTPGRPDIDGKVNGMASAFTGCQQCHGSLVGFAGRDGKPVTMKDLEPDAAGKPTNLEAVARITKNADGKPIFSPGSWPNTGIGRINVDGSRGSCSACHSRHDFSPRRARQPENCGKCHLGPDHPQKEIYDESKHGIAFADLRHKMNLDAKDWVLGKDYSAAPTCATCHMSGHSKNEGTITHDPGQRISWTNRPPISLAMDTDINGKVVTEADPAKRNELVKDTWQNKRDRMTQVCSHCHTNDYISSFYKQYDDFVQLYNEKFAKPGTLIMNALKANGLITKPNFDEEIEWTWFYLWHHEGRRARHGAAMMAPDYAHWHGMYEVAERFYMELIPQAREHCEHGRQNGKAKEADDVLALIDSILARPEHKWSKGEAK
ncbi:MAG: hydroxylamine oxidoreductase [Planctomycetes bacterium]|nr:hydroxylamine oxidoreductase [Planctomycetota bacterium]